MTHSAGTHAGIPKTDGVRWKRRGLLLACVAIALLALAFLYSHDARQLAWFDRSGKQIEGFVARGPYFNPSLSPDGKRIAASRLYPMSPPTGNIWILDPVQGSASQFTFGAGAQLLPIWSPDGRRIVYGLCRPPDYGLYWKDAQGSGSEELLLETTQWSVPMDWSRDGRSILFAQQDSKTKWHLWVLPLAGDRRPVPMLQTEFNEGDGRFSPDGHWIAYWSDESGRWEVYVRPFTAGGSQVSGGKWRVSTAGGTWPRWRRDGKELFFKALDGKLMAVPVKAGATFEAGAPVALFDPHDLEPDNLTYDVSPDGQRFLISRVFGGIAARSVKVCRNWLAGAKR